ncbi:hypothetical protein OG858_47035 (plasmid) [Streptomyces europaeiscabiei]|uniref:hypothetical protein n=1 Tax=Streptomyces europaeiscabiei TaxID=146819 RepID=UPI002E819333|nr:hypothetical protein [Streptomyces europaeiscabiei]WUD38863.1 hypothetical protein OG858_47035 [Streptomyces europaeiscabiei]
MSALPHEPGPRPYADPHRLEAHEGPQTPAELRAALAVISPTALVAFNAEFDAAKFGSPTQAEVVAKYRRTVAFATRPEVTAAITASLDNTADARPVAELWAHLDRLDDIA